MNTKKTKESYARVFGMKNKKGKMINCLFFIFYYFCNAKEEMKIFIHKPWEFVKNHSFWAIL